MSKTKEPGLSHIYLIVLILFTSFLALYNLDGYPPFISMDEGRKLVLAKNFAVYDKYALLTNEGFSSFGGGSGSAAVNTGITLMLPVAFAFKILGVELWSARFVIALYLIGSVAALYLCVRSLYNDKIALLAIPLFLFAGPPWLNTVAMGRWVYGEIPALAFFFLGCAIWFRAILKVNLKLLLLASICFGLAVLTKDIFSVMLTATLVSVFFTDRLITKSLKLKQIAIPILFCVISVIGWRMLLSSQTIGIDKPGDDLFDAVRIRLLVLEPQLWYKSLKFLAEQNLLLWIIPALTYTLLIALNHKNGLITSRELFFPFFVIIWMSWYVIGSIGWHRYAYPGWAVSSILMAKFLYDLARKFTISWPSTFSSFWWSKFLPEKNNLPILLLILFMVLWPVQNTVRRIATGDNQPAKIFADYIEANLPSDVLIASEEWEIDFLTNRAYLHHTGTGDAYIKHLQLGYPLEKAYDIASYEPDYVINGPYNKGVGFISEEFLNEQCELMISIGEYELYRVQKRDL